MSSVSHGRLYRIDLREFGMSVFFAAIVLFAAAMAMLSRNVSQISESYGWVEKSNAVLKSLYAVELKIWGVEMTVRGYAISQDPVFVQVHRYNRQTLLMATKALEDIVASEPALQVDYVKLRAALVEHETLYSSLMALGPGHQSEVAEAITSSAKRHARMAAIAALRTMREKEQGLLAERQRAAEHKAKLTYRLAVSIAGLAFLTGTLGFTLTLFGRRRQEEQAHASQPRHSSHEARQRWGRRP